MLRTRVLSALVLIPLLVALVYLGGLAWLAAVLVIGVLAWREMAYLLELDGLHASRVTGFTLVVGLIAEAYVTGSGLVPQDLLRPLLALGIIASLTWALFCRNEHATVDWGMTLASSLYVGFMLGFFVTLRQRPDGLRWVLLAFVVTWTIDASAYGVGRVWGRHKWWPRLSPKKTWEGLIGGSLAGIFVAAGLAYVLLGLAPGWGLFLGLWVAVVDPLGDLAVSLFKRRAAVKDSGSLIPGHGGVLDRIDSLLFTVPAVALVSMFLAGV